MFDNEEGSPTAFGAMWAFGSMLVVIFLAAMDATVVATTLPAITEDLGGVDQVGWVVAGFLLATAVSIPIWGKASDLIARRRLYLLAAAVFVVSSAAIAVAPTMNLVIAARVAQGVGTGGLMALTPTIVGVLFPAEVRGRYQGIMGAVLAGAGVVGPIVGGGFADGIGWRWAFGLNLPLGVAALAIVWVKLRLDDEPAGGRRLDVVGAALISTAAIAMLLAFGEGATSGSSIRVALLVIVGASTAGYVWWQHRRADPIVPLHLLASRTVGGGVALGLIGGVVMIVVSIHVPLARQTVDQASATSAGLALIPLTVAVMIASLAGGVLVTRLGRYRPVVIAGALLSTIGMVLVTISIGDEARSLASVGLLPVGTGIGFTLQPALLAVQHAVSPADLGTATASTAFFRQIGSTLAIGVALGALTNRAATELETLERGDGLDADARQVLTDALTTNLTATAIAAGVGVIIAVAMPDRRLTTTDRPQTIPNPHELETSP